LTKTAYVKTLVF